MKPVLWRWGLGQLWTRSFAGVFLGFALFELNPAVDLLLFFLFCLFLFVLLEGFHLDFGDANRDYYGVGVAFSWICCMRCLASVPAQMIPS